MSVLNIVIDWPSLPLRYIGERSACEPYIYRSVLHASPNSATAGQSFPHIYNHRRLISATARLALKRPFQSPTDAALVCQILPSRLVQGHTVVAQLRRRTDESLRSTDARNARGGGDCGSVERASPQGRTDGRIAGRGPGRRSAGCGACMLGPSG